MNPVLKNINPHFWQLKPYQPGRMIEDVTRERNITQVIKLASNENPLGPGEKAKQVLQEISPSSLRFYPDGNGSILRTHLASQLGINADCIILGNGSNEILELAAQLTLRPGKKAVYSQYAFIVYPLATIAHHATPIVVDANSEYGHDLEAMAKAAQTHQAQLLYVANPNNPTGTWHSEIAIDRFLAQVPKDTLVVLDEAYCEYAEQTGSIEKISQYPNLLVTRTFSKIHGLAGLRIGYGIAHPEMIEILNRIRQPFNTNTIAQKMAKAALSDVSHIEKSKKTNQDGMAKIISFFRQHHLTFIPSFANFISFYHPQCNVIYERMLNNGVIVRKLEEYHLSNWLRITIGTEAETEKFLQILNNQE